MVVQDADFPHNEIRIVVSPSQAKRLTETTRPTTQSIIWPLGVSSIGPHHSNPGQRLQRSNKDPGSDANRLTYHIG
jgi:hypothetical protein